MAVSYATVTWDQLHRDARLLAGQLMRHGPFRGIVAITRGGLIPAAIIGRELDCRLIESVSVVSYDQDAMMDDQTDDKAGERTQGEPRVLKAPTAAGDGEGFLIIDDLVDSGVTAQLVRSLLPKAIFACLYAKPSGRPATDLFVVEVPQDTWILFPWDTAPLFVLPLARQAVEPMARQDIEPMARPGIEPMARPGIEAVARRDIEPVASRGVEPVASRGVEPLARHGIKPVARPGIELAVSQDNKPG